MKVTIEKNELIKKAGIVMKAIPGKTTMPILGCILIEANEKGIRFKGNDMELGIVTKVEGTVQIHGNLAVDARFFSEVVRKIPNGDIVIENDERFQTTVSCGNTKVVIPAKPGDDFPETPKVDAKNTFYIAQEKLAAGICQTAFSVQSEGNNQLMTGVHFEVKDYILKLVTLDGHRISVREIPLDRIQKNENCNMNVTVPGKKVYEFSKLLTSEKLMRVSVSESHIQFDIAGASAVMRLINGEYFNVARMFSEEKKTVVTLNKKEVIESLERSMLFIREGEKKPVIMKIEDDMTEFSVKSASGEIHDKISCKREGEDVMIGMNPRFLYEVLRTITEDSIEINLKGPKDPILVCGEGYKYLILPVNLNQPEKKEKGK